MIPAKIPKRIKYGIALKCQVVIVTANKGFSSNKKTSPKAMATAIKLLIKNAYHPILVELNNQTKIIHFFHVPESKYHFEALIVSIQ